MSDVETGTTAGEGNNRTTDPIQNQTEAEGLRASLAERLAIPPADLTTVQEEAIAVDQARLAQWDSEEHPPEVEGHSPELEEADDDGTEEADV